MDLDADYKLPKILRNYKGTDVLPVQVPAFRSNTAMKLRPAEPRDSRKESRDTFSGGASPTRSSVTSNPVAAAPAFQNSAKAAPRASLVVNGEWNAKWGKFIPPGRNVLYTSQIGKKNPLGLMLMRQLLLTDEPSLLYVDVASSTVKGDIDWTRNNPPRATFVSAPSFN